MSVIGSLYNRPLQDTLCLDAYTSVIMLCDCHNGIVKWQACKLLLYRGVHSKRKKIPIGDGHMSKPASYISKQQQAVHRKPCLALLLETNHLDAR